MLQSVDFSTAACITAGCTQSIHAEGWLPAPVVGDRRQAVATTAGNWKRCLPLTALSLAACLLPLAAFAAPCPRDHGWRSSSSRPTLQGIEAGRGIGRRICLPRGQLSAIWKSVRSAGLLNGLLSAAVYGWSSSRRPTLQGIEAGRGIGRRICLPRGSCLPSGNLCGLPVC